MGLCDATSLLLRCSTPGCDNKELGILHRDGNGADPLSPTGNPFEECITCTISNRAIPFSFRLKYKYQNNRYLLFPFVMHSFLNSFSHPTSDSLPSTIHLFSLCN